MKKYYAGLLLLPLLLTSCFKTAEEIKREKQIDDQLVQSSKTIGELRLQINDLQSNIANTSGQIEEIGHKQKVNKEEQTQNFVETIAQLSTQMKVLTAENKKTQDEISSLKLQVSSQKKFIQKITKTLGSISGSENKSRKKVTLKNANYFFNKNKQSKAKSQYLKLLASKKLSKRNMNLAYYRLGLMDFWNRRYNEGLVYFSKIYTNYPKSRFAAPSLYHIAKSFKKLKKNDEAQASFKELIKSYPKSSEAKKSQKEIK